MAYSEKEFEENQREVRFLDLFNPTQPRSENEKQAYRLSICEKCEFFRQISHTCKKCGCFMKLKTSLDNAKCPIGKW